MEPLSRWMHSAAHMARPQSSFFGKIGARCVVVAGCVPLELAVGVRNLIALPFQAVQATVKIPARIFNIISFSKSLDEFDESLKGPITLIGTALKVVGYVIGSLSTLTLGLVSPKANFRLHVAIGLVRDLDAEVMEELKQEEKRREKEEFDIAIRKNVKSLVDAIKRKSVEKGVVPPLSKPVIEPVIAPVIPEPLEADSGVSEITVEESAPEQEANVIAA